MFDPADEVIGARLVRRILFYFISVVDFPAVTNVSQVDFRLPYRSRRLVWPARREDDICDSRRDATIVAFSSDFPIGNNAGSSADV